MLQKINKRAKWSPRGSPRMTPRTCAFQGASSYHRIPHPPILWQCSSGAFEDRAFPGGTWAWWHIQKQDYRRWKRRSDGETTGHWKSKPFHLARHKQLGTFPPFPAEIDPAVAMRPSSKSWLSSLCYPRHQSICAHGFYYPERLANSK